MTGGFITINGIKVPYPDMGSGLQEIETAVTAGFNLKNIFIGSRVGRDRNKINLQWSKLPTETWAKLLQTFDSSFVTTVEYFDMRRNAFHTRKFYCGNRSARPWKVDKNTGQWIAAADCSVNLVDTGVGA